MSEYVDMSEFWIAKKAGRLVHTMSGIAKATSNNNTKQL